MSKTIRIVGISGSLRSGSYNSALLRAALQVLPTDVQLEIGTIKGIPLYDGDVEANEGIPAAVQTLKVFGDRPVTIMGAIPGGFGTVLSQAAWLPVFRALGMRPWFGPKMLVSHANRSSMLTANCRMTMCASSWLHSCRGLRALFKARSIAR